MAGSPRAAEVRQQLDRILSDAAFSGASRRSRLLRYLVEEALEDRLDALKESVIPTEVFERQPDYDPQVDSAVRVEVGRLRARLAEYYDQAGREDPVRIDIPKGTYRPLFVFREEKAPEAKPSQQTWKTPAAAFVALIAVVTGFVIWRARTPSFANPAAVAVLPFLNLGGDATDNYLGDGISEELTETLAEFSDLRVVARTSAFHTRARAPMCARSARTCGRGR
jgi:adenylate cyclase